MRTDISKDFSKVPPFTFDGRILIRGTLAWDDREKQREIHGCALLSYGSIKESLLTKGKSSGRRFEKVSSFTDQETK